MNCQKDILAVLLLIITLTIVACSSNDDNTTIPPDFHLSKEGVAVEQLTFTSNSNVEMITLQSNVEWSISSDQEWCRLSNHSGDATLTDYQTVNLQVKVDVNTGDVVREATITMIAGNETKTVKVTQYSAWTPDPIGWELAVDAVKNMRVGLNIGNTLDANGSWITGTQPSDFETAWGNPVITHELIQTIKAGGFNAIRLPVTWYQHLDVNNRVNEAWMNRVEEVVNYILEEGMYCIVNVHHDTGASDEAWLCADLNNYDAISTKFAVLWAQIAERFADYGDKLLFEGYNEMLDAKHSWSNTDADGYNAHNQLAQLFVNTVRATGGKNASRNLIVCTYSADPNEPTISNFLFPDDVSLNHLIAEVHVYAPGYFTSPVEGTEPPVWTSEGEKELDKVLKGLNNRFTSQGIPLIIGEFGAQDKASEAEQVKYAEYFVRAATQQNIATFWWFDLLDRTTYQWKFPAVKNTLVTAKK